MNRTISPSNATANSFAHPHAQSALRWLMDAGVTVEVSDTPRNWLALPESVAGNGKPAAAPAASTPSSAPLIQYEKYNDIAALNAFLTDWKGLGITRTVTHTLVGTGPAEPALMVISDAPDAYEDQHGVNFGGQGNRLILDALRHAGMQSDALYKTYLSKWRPPGQKALSPNEVATLAPLLEQEIALIRPKAILAMGESTLRALGAESLRNSNPDEAIRKYTNQYLNYEIPFFASQKGEFLVKTAGMKKNFWLGLTRFLETLRADGSPSVNYTE